MTDTIRVAIAPERTQVRLLATTSERDTLKAILPPVRTAHPRAAATLLEGLALWYQQRLCVVLCADELGNSSELGLYDDLGFGHRTLHYEVGVAFAPRRCRRRELRGLGDFRDLRQLSLLETVG
ncbi:MAG: hypothetical protein IT379_41460 [Deltaproteobacteria bacterium]|nr:hypothetical protein [Deltaproteobacteria bacterium]